MPGTRHPAGRCQAPAATSTQLLQGEFGLRALFILIFLALSWLPFTPGGSWKLHVQGPSPERPWEASTEPAPAPTHPCPIPARSGAAGRAVNGALRACSCIGLPSPNPSPVSPRGEGEAAGRCLAATPCSESTRRARAAACSRLLQPSWVLLARGRGGGHAAWLLPPGRCPRLCPHLWHPAVLCRGDTPGAAGTPLWAQASSSLWPQARCPCHLAEPLCLEAQKPAGLWGLLDCGGQGLTVVAVTWGRYGHRGPIPAEAAGAHAHHGALGRVRALPGRGQGVVWGHFSSGCRAVVGPFPPPRPNHERVPASTLPNRHCHGHAP